MKVKSYFSGEHGVNDTSLTTEKSGQLTRYLADTDTLWKWPFQLQVTHIWLEGATQAAQQLKNKRDTKTII